MRGMLVAAAAALVSAGAARAEVTDRSAAGFEVVEATTIAAPAAKVWAAIMRPAGWWDGNHTWSHSAKNLYFDPNGCFCERLPRGAVRHMTITYADEGSQLRLFGGLGPLQFTGASGSLVFVLKAAGAATNLTVSYDVGGYAKGGLAENYAAPVDMVLGQQVARLKKYVETGKPE